ncbi:MAG: VCBS repeat-containing protein, partial [bacterium]
KVLGQFIAYAKSFTGGVRVAAGDLNGDGKDEIVTAPGPGGGPQIKIFRSNGKLVKKFTPYDTNYTSGLSVAVADVNGDGQQEILTAPGLQKSSLVRVFTAAGKLTRQFFPFAKQFQGGISIASGHTD